MYSDPLDACKCVTEEELIAMYPSWASFDDIIESISFKPEPKNEFDYVKCPIEEYERECTGKNNYWNELACACFKIPEGEVDCPDNEVRDPFSSNDCIASDVLMGEYYRGAT